MELRNDAESFRRRRQHSFEPRLFLTTTSSGSAIFHAAILLRDLRQSSHDRFELDLGQNVFVVVVISVSFPLFLSSLLLFLLLLLSFLLLLLDPLHLHLLLPFFAILDLTQVVVFLGGRRFRRRRRRRFLGRGVVVVVTAVA